MKYLRTLIPALIVLLFSHSAFATDRVAKTCEFVDVKAAVDSAVVGDRVLVPAGRCIWTTSLGYSKISLEGPGKDSSGQWLTWITLDMGATIYALGDNAQFSGMLLKYDGGATAQSGAPAVLNVDGQNFRVHHYGVQCTHFCTALFALGSQVGKHPTGLVDHLESASGRVAVYGDGLNDWSEPSTIGVANAVGVVTIEDSVIDMTNHCINDGHCGNAVDTELTGRYILRHSKIINTGAEVHSNQGTRNGRNWEISDNIFVSNNGWFAPMFIRGGTGVAFNNVMSGFSFTITMDNVNTTCAYPCKDQIGRGRDLPDGTQQLEPAYFWNNISDGAPSVPRLSCCLDLIKEGRDYFNTPRPGYVQSPYPHPLQAGSVPTPEPPQPPQPVPNQPPTLNIKAPIDGLVITTKSFTISIEAMDDLGVAWEELSINGQIVKAAATATMSYSWNTSPYKGKTVIISATAKDADGVSVRKTATVTVKK